MNIIVNIWIFILFNATRGWVLNKIILSLVICLGTISSSQVVLASDNKLSRSCLKANPLMTGETDANLIELYEGYCDRKNVDSKYSYLARAAQRFQQLGQNYKALQLVGELETLNLQGNTITDVKFLASANLANQALTQMKSTENRYLTSDGTYPIAKKLSENIELTKSHIILKMESPTQSQKQISQKSTVKTSGAKSTKSSVKKPTSSTLPKKTNKAVTPVKSAPSNTNSGSPFGFTQK